jgi:hypothetical protein
VAVVGDAYIVVKAITSGFEKDVRRSLNGINLNSDGESIGESFIEGFSSSLSKGLGKKFDFSASEADAARATFQSLVRTNFVLTASIGPLISSLGSLGGGFVSLLSIVGAATPALVVLPGIFTAIGLAAITTVAALGGVGKAVSAGLNQQKKATQENTAAKIAAAHRVEDIEKRIEELNKDSFRLERDRLKDLAEAEQDKAKAAEDAAAKEQEAVEKKTLVVQEAAKKEKEAIEEKAEKQMLKYSRGKVGDKISTYSSYTRQSCNFVFPLMAQGLNGETRPRPRNFKLNDTIDRGKVIEDEKDKDGKYYAIDQYLKSIESEESSRLGEGMLNQALKALHISPSSIKIRRQIRARYG